MSDRENASAPALLGLFGATLRRDLLLAYRSRGELFNPLIFFLIVITMVPLGITPDPVQLARLAPGMIWVVALLATLLSLDSLFRSDFDDGTLEQYLITPQPLYLLVLAKVLVHWLVTGVPLTLLAPLLGVMLSLPASGFSPLILSLLVGTATLSLVGAIGAALTVGLRRGGLLLSLIIMPLYAPVLIFGASAVASAADAMPYVSQLAVLGAMLAVAIVSAPFAAAGALRVSANG
ncbi:heme exporter protein CcmB [Halioxenophilus sp. WMMB6]|uniref:heme exporter protein CcmB n=1 Tax=Halioxenophilus sp. WMMB6 TaxID=3073815 RepID=UPI00295F38A5|nr:heme exporter protein CcmB [Halioxenophilus sp. WMMB6]